MLVLSIMTRVAVMGQMGGQTGAGGAGLTGAGGAGGGGFEGQLENVRCPPLRCSLPVSPCPSGVPSGTLPAVTGTHSGGAGFGSG